MKVMLLLATLNSLTGTWIGNVLLGKDPTPVRLEITAPSGTLSLPLDGISKLPLTAVEAAGADVSFKVQNDKLIFSFRGKWNERTIRGDVQSGEQTGTFEVVRTSAVRLDDYFGVYKFEDDTSLYIRTWDELGENQLTFFDDQGRAGPLFAIDEVEFFTGPSLWIPLPQSATIRFAKDTSGQISGLTWSDSDGKNKKAFRMEGSFKEEEVTFENRSVRLAGSLVIPEGSGPFPAVVLIHGSGAVTRDFFGPIAYLLASRGIAVLSYDKRGTGKSAGHWMEMSFVDYAQDALAGVQYLRTRKQIHPDRIGLWGASQAGWIIPEATMRDERIRFAVMLSVPGVTPYEQEVQRMEEEMKAQNIPPAEIQKAVQELKGQIESLRTAEVKSHLEKELSRLKNEGKEEALKASGTENPQFLLWYTGILDHSPIPALEKMKCPVLVLYGAYDRGVPFERNKPLLEAALKKAKNDRASFHIFPKGNHALLLSETGSMREFPYLTRFVPGLFDHMVSWIHATVK